MLLLDLELHLQSFEKLLSDFGLPVPTPEQLARVKNITSTDPVVIREELDYDRDELMANVENTVPTFTDEQANIYNTIMEAVKESKPVQVFIDARGGCGKTYLLNAILGAVRSLEPDGCVALAMATTGIAANLLNMGRTFHSRMKAPLNATPETTLNISAQSPLAKLVKMAKILLIDEATMLDRYMLEALDRTLQDIMGKPNLPFGGKVLLFAGDFRQCLVVIKGASRAGIVKCCINRSPLWKHFKIMKLTLNMRVQATGDPVLEAFDNWTLGIGNGEEGQIEVPEDMVTKISENTADNRHKEEQSMKEFVEVIFPDIATNIQKENWLDGRAILAPLNKEVNSINTMIHDMLPEEAIKLASADSLGNPEDTFRFNTEYINTIQPNGFPQHMMSVKSGMPMMLLRNLSPKQGLCNGTRLKYEKLIGSRVLQCKIVGSQRTVLIPQITFRPTLGEYPFEWKT